MELDGLLLPPVGRPATLGPPPSPPDPPGRARTYTDVLPAGAVVCRGSALWVHTGRFRPVRLEASGSAGQRVPGGSPRCRAAALDDGDVVVLGGVPVTTPVRTACDLARFWQPAAAADGLLALRAAGLALEEVAEALARYRGRPHVRRARDLVDLLR